MKVEGLILDPTTKTPVVVLRDAAGRQTLPVWIGVLEAANIAFALDHVPPPRPLTHDLLLTVLGALEGDVRRVDLDSLEENVFHAKLHLRLPRGVTQLVDCRPSDAIAVALRVGAPIYAEEKVLEKAALRPKESQKKGFAGHDAEYWKRHLEGLDASAFGKYKM
jgi:bifunctional DNase/RNase